MHTAEQSYIHFTTTWPDHSNFASYAYGRELDRVEQKTEAWGNGVRWASKAQSTWNTKEQRQRVQWKQIDSEFSTCHCGSRWKLQHLTNVFKKQILTLFIHASLCIKLYAKVISN